MSWTVIFHPAFAVEVRALSKAVRIVFGASFTLLQERGPNLGRPDADTLKGSRHTNMKELRFNAEGGVWRVAFAFDPERRAVLLVGGDKRGQSSRRFYETLIRIADERFDEHLAHLEDGE